MSDRVTQIASHLNYPTGMLAGQVAIITGSGQGIGAETARLLASEGAKVVVADVPLRRPGTPTEAASVILTVVSPLFSYDHGDGRAKHVERGGSSPAVQRKRPEQENTLGSPRIT
ncbi:hypothetical protein LX32DRAFT_726365 [Colletotrichum zoysiae]|uniref:Uncharacterized protein n=1 Tax=Colletotrichum zoysiae TaxID=1216348 RepID=A0AAD9HMR2_9PEZI|nr:hypothetical protein LX32DRAFT_726365 [Colletotrichum zoysiae]